MLTLGEKFGFGYPGGDVLEVCDSLAAGTGEGESDSWLEVLDGVAVLDEETEGDKCFFFFFFSFFGVVGSSSSLDKSCARLGWMVKRWIVLMPAMLWTSKFSHKFSTTRAFKCILPETLPSDMH